MKPPPDLTFEQDVMSCPACGEIIRARCIADMQIGLPALDPSGRNVAVEVASTLKRFNLNHACGGRVEAEPGPDADD